MLRRKKHLARLNMLRKSYSVFDFFTIFFIYRVEPENAAEYGSNYYNSDRLDKMKVGYVHPYHSEGSPIYMSNLYFMKTLFQAVGPE